MIKRAKEKQAIPVINYLDMLDTKKYGENQIDSCDLLSCSKTELYAMEANARVCSVLFIPFRGILNLKDEHGNFLPGFRSFLLGRQPNQFRLVHQQVLKNIQDCRNSMSAGRPLDPLERITRKPDILENNTPENQDNDDCIEIYESLISDLDNIFTENVECRTLDDVLSINTTITTGCGSSGCGTILIKAPKADINANVILESQNNVRTTEIAEWYTEKTEEERAAYVNNLYILATTHTTRTTAEGVNTNIHDTRCIQNIRTYADSVFNNDKDQKLAFELIVSSFVVELYKMPQGLGKRRYYTNVVKDLKDVNHKGQFIAFLSGPGGTGKSKVIHAVICYCKELCENAGIPFNKNTIVVTALTGAAAVSIFGETTHAACCLNRKVKSQDIDTWKGTLMVIIDEISFASEYVLSSINTKLNILKERSEEGKFGGIPIVFAGDFTQLEPVKARPLFLNTENPIWYDYVNTFIELKTNHRFYEDPDWGNLLQRMRLDGSSPTDLKKINSRVVNYKNQINEHDIPSDTVYATSNNNDKAAINDGIFAKYIAMTHSKQVDVCPPLHTICIKASNIQFKQYNTNQYNKNGNKLATDIIYSSCNDAHIKDNDAKRHDPILKLYKDRPLCINKNMDVANCIANGAMCKFKGVVLEDDISVMHKILIDGYYVNCIDASSVKALVVEMIDGNHNKNNPKIVHLQLQKITASIHFPMPLDGPITKVTKRIWRKIKFEQFPINVANARTVQAWSRSR